MDRMRRRRIVANLGLGLVVLVVSSCGGATPKTATTSSTSPSTTQPVVPGTTTTEAVTARASVSPDQGAAGTPLTFRVEIRGAGTLHGEDVRFGDGNTSGGNAGIAACGSTARADHTSSYPHAYTRPGTYQFSDQVTVQTPPPSCAIADTTVRLTVIVAAPLSEATLNGAFLSPTRNIGCYINPVPPGSLRCATFAPPRLVTMDANGAIQTCSGNQCNLGNPATQTPVLPYGSATAEGPFQCLSRAQGMLCTVVGHKGFELSKLGAQTIG